MISGHRHKPVIIPNLQVREPGLKERLNCSSLHNHSQSQDTTPDLWGSRALCPFHCLAGLVRLKDLAVKNTFTEILWTQLWGKHGEAELAYQMHRMHCSVPLWWLTPWWAWVRPHWSALAPFTARRHLCCQPDWTRSWLCHLLCDLENVTCPLYLSYSVLTS